MKKLTDILGTYPTVSFRGNTDRVINKICFDSREVTENDMFIAVEGTVVDGHDYIDKAVAQGATTVVCEKLPEKTVDEVCYLLVENSAKAMGIFAANYYDHPSAKLKLVGVTGTNGKTTVATVLYRLFRELGYNSGLISTVENKVNDTILPAKFTTPDAIQLNKLLSEMVKQKCTHCFMEVSSHALSQERVEGIHYIGALFTNITHDHLDYHKTFDNYIKAKKILFDNLSDKAFAIVNKDDRRGMVMVQNCSARIKTFSLKAMADFKGKMLDNSFEGLLLEIDNRKTWFRLIGAFNASNLLAVYSTAVMLGEDSENVLTQLSAIAPAKGRFDQVISEDNRAIVDYSHTPDALENVLKTINELRKLGERIITVVGCGGDRDKTKRPKMAAIAAKLSDKVILTSDNPRTEIPEQIIKDMEAGLDILGKTKTLSITDRKEAIRTACMLAGKGDIILVAGKGHENYQEINGVRHHFDDKEILEEIFSGKN
ncbi:UDP-N-acetylmuramoyl-L-alanyl-D-glutamate--2,6-diaminopimelate ligase [Chondrinema litorale]|uniref:UDP-N-acetylmuramoyl-L-alanyl-D-glutamate--2, 6-diaminopimelate ligase n=1 Tax=Chondrinema litorale TaxID=2994555 RepID=UPI003D6FDC68